MFPYEATLNEYVGADIICPWVLYDFQLTTNGRPYLLVRVVYVGHDACRRAVGLGRYYLPANLFTFAKEKKQCLENQDTALFLHL